MICPRCRADNSNDSLRCIKCGIAFPVSHIDDTIEGSDISALAREPAPARPLTASMVATPPPVSALEGPTFHGPSPASAGSPLTMEPGTNFGPRYRIESILGAGGMGSVYKACDLELDRIVALKLVRPELTSDAAVMQRFKQELLLASKITHKNVLRIHDLGDVGGVKFISMTYVEGEDLNHLLRRERPLSIDRSVGIALQLCAGLEAAHSEGVVHRDLKPQNVLLDRSGTAYISDFGLAKSLEAGAIGMTSTGQFLGTPRYMSPEQVEGEAVDHRSDLYSLGLILYEMVTGDVPFTGDSTLQVMYQRTHNTPKNPKTVNPAVPDYLARIIMRCLQRNPAQRYQQAREILNDLQLEHAPSHSRSVQISLPLRQRRVWLLGAAGVVILALLLIGIFLGRGLLHRRPSGPALGTDVVMPALQEKYLAVLPLQIIGDEASLRYQAQGIVEALAAKFSQLNHVHVASANVAEKFANEPSLDKIGRELGVNLVLRGAIEGAENKITIKLNLDNTKTGTRVWEQEFPGNPKDLLTLEDHIYSKLVDVMGLKLTNDELARSTGRPTENVGAYDLYLKGRSIMRSQHQENDVGKAIDFYARAVNTDPRFALAYAGLADAYLLMYDYKKDSSWTDKALDTAQQADQLGDQEPEVHYSLGSVYLATGKTQEAIAELKRALELRPNSDQGLRRLGSAYLANGRKDEALAAYREAVKINPYYWVNPNLLGGAELKFGNYDKALEQFQRVIQLNPDDPIGYSNVGLVYYMQGKWEQCIPVYEKALAIQPNVNTYTNLGVAYFYQGKYDEAVKIFEKAVALNPGGEMQVGNLADGYRWIGQKEKAKATYERAIELAYKEYRVNPRQASTLASLALYYAKEGDAKKGLDFIHRARSIDPNNVDLINDEVLVDTLANRLPDALAALRQAFQKGYSPEEAKHDPELKSLRALPEFEGLAKEFSARTTK